MRKITASTIFFSALAALASAIFILPGHVVAADAISIGWFGPLSGPVASLGEENLRGVQLAIKKYGAAKIKLLVEDDQFLVKNSVSAYEALKTRGVFMMMSPTYNGVLALAAKADRDKIILANCLDASTEIARAGEYVVGLGYYADGHGNNFARTISQYGAKKVAVIYNEGETFTQLIVNTFKNKYAGSIVLLEGYSPTTSDFRATITKMRSLKVDTVLLIGWDEAGFFVKQSNDLGFLPTVIGLASFTSSGFLKNAGAFRNTLYYLGWDPLSKAYQEIVQLYRQQYGQAPTQPLFVALGYDAMTFVLKALEGDSTPEEFRKNIYSTSLEGLTGTLRLDSDGIMRGITSQSNLYRVEAPK
jgi:branched-chain amino acid transport system substrate-binding protein